MILKTITLKNFRKFKNTSIELPDGVTGVIGLNGVGKSTIFEAIAWVLYGPVAARTSSDQIKRTNAEHPDPCRVELEFIFEDNAYRIFREIVGKNNTASATVTINKKVAATGAEVVSRYMQKKIGMDFKSFYTSIFAKQKELNALSNMNASERRPLILRMLGIDSLDEIIKEIKSDKKNNTQLIKKLESNLTDSFGKNKTELKKLEIKEKNKQKNILEKDLTQIKQKIKIFKNYIKNSQNLYKKNKKEYEQINKEKERLQEQKTLFENKKKLSEEIKIFEEKIKTRTNEKQKEENRFKKFKGIEENLKESDKKIKQIMLKMEKITSILAEKKALIKRAKHEIAEIKLKKKKIKTLGPNAKCPTCDRILADQHDHLIKNFENDIQLKEKEISIYEKEINMENRNKQMFSRQEEALQKKKSFIQKQLREKDRIDITLNNISKELKQEIKELSDKKKSFEKIGVVKFDAVKFKKVKQEVQDFYKKYQDVLDKLNNEKDELKEKEILFEKTQGELKLKNQEIKNINEKIKELEKAKNMIKEQQKITSYQSMLSDIMADFRTHLISRIRPVLSSYSSDFFERLTDGKYFEMELDENYEILIYDEGVSYKINRFSGGEEDLANLCIRLAISELITERAGGVFNFIILDEIFGSQDSIRRQNIMKALNGLSSKFRQIFLITHIDDVKNDMENIIFVSEDEEGISSIKVE